MEEDNKKRRRGARREFQENVRSLVEFVRKRDRRVAAWQQQEEVAKQQRLAAEAQRSALPVPVPSQDARRDRLHTVLPSWTLA